MPFYDTSFFTYKNCFQGFFLPDEYSLYLKTLQQSQDPVLKTVYSWLFRNEKPEFLTPLITGTPFLHAYYKRFSQLFIEDSTNLISLYTTNTKSSAANHTSSPNIIRNTIRICLPFRMFRTVFNKLHEHSHKGIKIIYHTFPQYYYIPYLEKWLSIFLHGCIECHFNENPHCSYTILFRTGSLFHILIFYGYKSTDQPSFTQQNLPSCYN